MKTILCIATALTISIAAKTQTIPELIFSNPVLESGTAGADGAKYRFSNVATNLDAVLEIKNRSSASIVVNNIDVTGVGWDKALQPEIGFAGGITPANESWWVEFKLTFYNAGTNVKKRIGKFFVTGIDIDGDNQSMQERVEMQRIYNLELSTNNTLLDNLLGSILDLLNLDNWGNDVELTGPVTNYTNIDTTATQVMATYEYREKKEITFKLGGINGALPSSAGLRLNSLWFKEFNLDLVTLPVKLTSFTATLNNNKSDLKWITASEINVSHFVIEKSFDGTNYSDAGIVFAYGSASEKTNYTYADNVNTAQEGVIYYRLRSVDIDGKTQYSEVRIIRIGKQSTNMMTVLTYPNPVTSELRVTIPNNWQNKKVVYELFNANGQVAKKTEATTSTQTEIFRVNELGSGFYILRVSCEGEVAQQKIIKQ